MMMKKIVVVIFCFISFSLISQTSFERVINPGPVGSINAGFCVQQVADGGYIIAAGGYNSISFYDVSYLIKTDSTGHVLWTKIYSASPFAGANWTTQTRDGH